MRLLSHRDPATGKRSFGVVTFDQVITASELASVGGLDETDALLDTYWLLASDDWHARVKAAHHKCIAEGLVGAHVSEFTPAAAVQTPEKIVCVGLNYRDHVAEGGRAAPERPLLFAKFANAVIADGQPIIHPAGSHALDLEAELGVVIGKRAHRVAAADAYEHIAGYVVTNDISARDWQGVKSALRDGEVGDGQWLRAKSSDTFLPMSAIIVTTEEVPLPHELPIRGWHIPGSGPDAGTPVLWQDASTSDMIWQIPELIEYISAVITLEPGDIISTGTPSGVGVFRDPPVFLQPGDRVRVEIGGIGGIDNPIVAEEVAAER